MKAFEINGDTVSLALFIDVTNSKYASFSLLNFPFVSWEKKMAYGILKMFKLLKQISVLYQLYLADFSFF